MGYGHFGGVLAYFAAGFGTLVITVVLAGVIFLLVRFLLVATTAAKIYVAQNTPAEADPAPATPAAPVTPPAPAPAAPPAPAAGPKTTPPATKPRTPKAPPAV